MKDYFLYKNMVIKHLDIATISKKEIEKIEIGYMRNRK